MNRLGALHDLLPTSSPSSVASSSRRSVSLQPARIDCVPVSQDVPASAGRLPGAYGSSGRGVPESPSSATAPSASVPPVTAWRCTMQRLRETFRRSKGGPVIESHLPSSVSLEVPKQVRSASFDEIRFKKEHDQDACSGDNLLMVPSTRNQRSRSFDSATTSSSSSSSSAHVAASSASAPPSAVPAGMVGSVVGYAAVGAGGGGGGGGGSGYGGFGGGITSLPVPSPPATATEAPCQLDVPKWRILRRSSSDKSQCAACIHCQYMDEFSRNTSRSNSPPDRPRYFSSGSETLEESESESAASARPDDEQVTDAEEDLLVSPTSVWSHGDALSAGPGSPLSLQVPQVAKGRSASVDSSFLQVPTPDPDLDPDLAAKAHRSRSVDIVLPTGAEPRYALCQPKERGHARPPSVLRQPLPASAVVSYCNVSTPFSAL
ncbi:hypothetical protein HPB50_022425 [Hyalomma asiaticum]|uniref:Uncharacterized protein n=1 Tax=Hyalomma asiaticum TaxID=266040 RepID=A0ACB7RTK3_HYAAI|nr:hypothetical protein HPB50_022425 [Hyalomma asiaticum]